MADLTPEEIQQARELAAHAPKMGYALIDTEAELLARAVLALTEQQPEPVSREELARAIHYAEHGPHGCPYGPNDHQNAAADALLSRYTITRKPQDGA